MTFRRDLETWTANQVAVRALSDQAKAIRRLLRGNDGGVLGPIDSQGLPGELREVYPPGRADVSTPPTSASWLCWPSSDNALVGWGDPYENPPGTPVNPPLGTVQSVYSDAANIARSIGPGDEVTHGTNQIAALRDWRDETSALVVSWDSGAVYSGGVAVKNATDLLAACVRWSGGTSSLLWMADNPLRIYSQECVVSDDYVTNVTGVITWCAISGTITDPWWCEFSQNGNSAVINDGSSVSVNQSLSVTVPAVLTGQAVSAALVEEAQSPSINYPSNVDYQGTQKFLVKTQFVGNSFRHVWLEIKIEFRTLDSWDITENIGTVPCNADPNYFDPEVCFWTLCGDTYYTRADWPAGAYVQSDGSEITYSVGASLMVDNDEIISNTLVDLHETYYRNSYNASYFNNNPIGWPDLPNPPRPGPNWSGWCDNTVEVDAPSQIFRSIVGARDLIDARTGRASIIHFADTTDKGNTYSTYLDGKICRNGVVDASASIPGYYGLILWPSQYSSNDAAKLESNLSVVSDDYIQADAGSIVGYNSALGGVAMDVTKDRAVQCVWAKELSDGLDRYVDLLEGADIDTLLSISSEPNPRISIKSAGRYLGLIKQ